MSRFRCFAFSKGWWIFLLVLFPLLNCTTITGLISPPTVTPTPTQTSTPTRTSIPMADRDLQDIVLKISDLPDGFENLPGVDGDELIQATMGDPEDPLSDNLETGAAVFYVADSASQLYLNILYVYRDAPSAAAAYENYLEILSKWETLDCPTIGTASRGLHIVGEDGSAAYLIVWQYHEAVVYLSYSGLDDYQFGELVRLAQVIQSRLEAG